MIDDHGARAAPDGQDEADGEQATVVAVGNLLDLIGDDGQHVGRDELANHPYDFVDQVGDREEARDRQEGQKRREESEKEIVGLLRAEVERVVGE